MPTVDAVDLRGWAAAVLEAAGLPAAHAATVADTLSYAEQRGLASHGYTRLSVYLDRIEAGGINRAARPEVVADRGAMAVIDGDDACGATSAVFAVTEAVERARRHGIGCTAVRRGNHYGAAGYYTDLIREAGMIGISVCNTDAVMSAPGGTRPVLGSNPLAISLPLQGEAGPRMDMATTQVSLGRLVVAAQMGEPIPKGWAVDVHGNPTEDPHQGLEGGLVPTGGPKGYALAFMIDALVALGGATISRNVAPLYGDPSAAQGLGFVFIAIDVPDPQQYRAAISSLVSAVRTSGPTVDGQPVVMYPGEPELHAWRRSDGSHELSPSLWTALQAIGRRHGIALVPSSASAL
ncbi:Ldh family oxidoreductase [Jiangella asiatica]|uniref:Ldh family oxidoreductase n=1 Tax=Jiangella asiatica TaxID=2530372 RepID=A0A4R5DG78_9ACTN|nr:Ldh family oxidoreductase [Jiangella asiatica]TDE09695.1 Ldh family oxidoreductase [Jiangella asiatica]